MKHFVSKHRSILGYVLYGVILTLALLYLRFPSHAVEEYVQAMGAGASPPLAVSVDRIAPSIPFGLKFLKTRVSVRNAPDRPILRADRLSIKPSLLSFLGGKSDYAFYCAAYKGKASGSISLRQGEKPPSIDTEIELTNVDLGEYTYLQALVGRTVKGTLSGTIVYDGQYRPVLNGSGKATLSMSEGVVELAEPFLTLTAIDFDELETDMVLNNRTIEVQRLAFKGKQLQGTLSGTITLREALTDSVLSLTGTIEPFAALFQSAEGVDETVAFLRGRLNKGTFTFMIKGTLGQPEIQFT
jgi:type II secretion system protein N